MASPVQTVELPSGATVYYREAQHAYYLGYDPEKEKCSKRIPGFSTVGKCVESNPDPLMGWAAKLEAQGAVELLEAMDPEEVPAVLGNGGEGLHKLLAEEGLDWRSVRDRRGQEGTAIHEKVASALARGKTPSLAHVSPDERPFGQAMIRAWLDLDPDPIAVEQVVYSPSWGVAGRFDLLARVDGIVTLIDAKTTKKPEEGRSRFINLGHHAQLAGYAYACAESGFETPDRARLLYLLDDGTYELEDCAASHDDFEAALAVYAAAKRIKKAASDGRKAAKKAKPKQAVLA